MPMISVTYELPLPNQFLVDHSQSQGKTRTTTYNGPDKIYLYIGEDGKEKHGPVTAEDLADGRPLPADSKLFEVDCTTNPLICQLRGPVIPTLQEERPNIEEPHPESPEVPGYPRYTYCPFLLPEDIYDRWSVTVKDGKIDIHAYTVEEKLFGVQKTLTWDDVREHRDKMLKNSDSAIAEDMPEALKEKWKTYRQKLRDLPTIMQQYNVSPNIAYYMFPFVPGTEPPGYVEK